MEKVEMRDSDGAGFTAYMHDGVPTMSEDIVPQLEGLSSLQCFDDDVCIVSCPKSGTHWLYEIIAMLVRKTTDYQPDAMLLERNPIEMQVNMPRPRVFVTHLRPKHVPKPITENRMKMVFIYRNPKDLVVSFFTFAKKVKLLEYQDAKFPSFLRMFLEGKVPGGRWLDYMMDWQEYVEKNPDYPFLILCYEEMKKDLKSNVKKIADFLETGTTEEDIDAIAQKCQFQALNQEKQKVLTPVIKAITDSNTNIFYRKGVAGDWKNWFTVADNELFDATLGTELSKLNLEFSFS